VGRRVLIVDDHAEFPEAAAYGGRVAAAPATGYLAKHDLSGKALAALVG